MTDSNTPTTPSDKALTPATRGRGRPMVPIDLDAVARLAGLGLTLEQTAARLGIGHRTLTQRLADDPAVREAHERGLARGVDFAASKLWEGVEAGNLQAVTFYLRTRGRWTIANAALDVTLRPATDAPPTIDGHVSELSERLTRLLDLPDPDCQDAEWSEIVDEPSPVAEPVDEPSAEELARLME